MFPHIHIVCHFKHAQMHLGCKYLLVLIVFWYELLQVHLFVYKFLLDECGKKGSFEIGISFTVVSVL